VTGPSLFDSAVVDAADNVVAQVLADVRTAVGSRRAVVVAAPAGAGKSFLVESAVSALLPDHSVVVVAPTNEQAFDLVRRIADRLASHRPTIRVANLHKKGLRPPADVAARPNVVCFDSPAPHTFSVVVGTLDKIADSLQRGNLGQRDVLIIDEAYQADASQYLRAGGAAQTHLLVGDPGQIDPFSTLDDGDYWRGLPEDPVQTAVAVVMRNHPQTVQHRLPITRRLAPSAASMAKAFYPGHGFGPAVLPGVRRLELALPPRRGSAIDRVIDEAAQSGWGYLELPPSVSLAADDEVTSTAVDVIDRVLGRNPTVECERYTLAALLPRRMAVAVTHRDQVAQVRNRLDVAGHTEVVVDTANRLQGLEFDLVVAVHPLCGLPEPDPFHLDPGRLCVMLTRHRHGCVVIGRVSDEALLDGVPPSTPAYVGWDPDPVLDGWAVHKSVYDTLSAYRVRV
jgi:hypothetical protein